MPIPTETLAAIAGRYTQAMTSIRARRVQRLLMRQFARFDHVLPANAEDGIPALFAVAGDGSAAVCRTDGRGPVAAVSEWAALPGVTVTTAYDLLKDSLPIVSWTVSHSAFADVGGALVIAAAELAAAECQRVDAALRGLGR